MEESADEESSFDPEKSSLKLHRYSYPDNDFMIYQLTCVICKKTNHPPTISCSSGHFICSSCYFQIKPLQCPANNCGATEKGQISCGKAVSEIDERVTKTSYYKIFVGQTTYSCGAKNLGCLAELSGLEILKHEKSECAFNYVRYCGYRRYGCRLSFLSLEQHLFHLIRDHDLPVFYGDKGHIMVRFDGAESMNLKGESDSLFPMFHAVFDLRMIGSKMRCLVFATAVGENDQHGVRIWLVKSILADLNKTTEADYEIFATACVYAPGNENDDLEMVAQTEHLKIFPSIADMHLMINDPVTREDSTFHFDILNETLNNVTQEFKGNNYFHLKVMFHKKSEKAGITEQYDDVKGFGHLEEVSEKINTSPEVEQENVSELVNSEEENEQYPPSHAIPEDPEESERDNKETWVEKCERLLYESDELEQEADELEKEAEKLRTFSYTYENVNALREQEEKEKYRIEIAKLAEEMRNEMSKKRRQIEILIETYSDNPNDVSE